MIAFLTPRFRSILMAIPLLPVLSAAQGTGTPASADARPTTALEATVVALWIREAPFRVGGYTPVTVRVSPNSGIRNPGGRRDDVIEAAVGYMESIPGSTGETWKSSAWIAALAASNANNDLLTEREFLLRVNGSIDGPSAGMMMATTMLALMRRDRILPDITISGTINPDGTIGPVSGIPNKIDGAASAGIKKLGYPLISDSGEEAFKKEMEALGKAKGIEMVPVTNIYDAYDLLTGVSLGHVKPLKPEELSPSDARNEWLRKAADSLVQQAMARMETAATRLSAMGAKAGADTKKDAEEDRSVITDYIKLSKTAAMEGQFRLAHYQATLAEQQGRISEKKLEWQQAKIRRDADALSRIYLDQFTAVDGQLAGALNAVQESLKSGDLGARITAMDAYIRYWNAKAQFLAAKRQREQLLKKEKLLRDASSAKKLTASEKEKLSEEIGDSMQEITMRLALQEGRIRAIAELAAVHFDGVTKPAPDQNMLNKRLAAAFGPTAVAGLNYVERAALSPDELSALSAGGSLNGGESPLARDQTYWACKMAAEFAVPRQDVSGEVDRSPEAAADRLASGAAAYLAMASLMNKYYNLREYTDDSGRKFSHGNESIQAMVERSRTSVLEEAARVKSELSFIPEPVRVSFDLGESKRTSPRAASEIDTRINQMDALTAYWRAHFLCKLSRMMAKGR